MISNWMQMRYVYGAAAMSASVLVFSYLQEREEEQQELSERQVSSVDFLRAVDELPVTSDQKSEITTFWRNLCRKMKQQQPQEAENPSIAMRDIQQFAHEYQRVFPDTFPESQVLDAAAVAASYPTKWNGIMESTSSMILSTSKRFQDIAKDTKGEMQHAVHRTVRNFLEKALDIVADRLKDQLKDPHMPLYLKDNIDVLVDKFMPDVKVEIFRKTRDLLSPEASRTKRQHRPGDATVSDLSLRGSLGFFQRCRANVLYHLFPYDKSIWMSFRDPWWILWTSVGLLPVIGQLWWLFLFVIKDKTNEHQLCQFIIGFKVAQFITLGLFYTCFGVMSYVRCIVHGQMDQCQQDGPKLETWNAFFFILQIALVWTAFFRLPYTVRPAESKHALLYRSNSASQHSQSKERKVFHDVFGNELHLNRGGYLMKLCGYETISFSIILIMISAVLWFPFAPWQRKALLYWIRTAYGLFSMPYVAFKVPVLATVLMHTRRMGYNEYGDTVRLIKRKPKQE